ncbi:glycosyltransferase family 9 protein [Campylobacter fetus]|uniref:glycosyltransferase family 9 protein n=1 Tax=Campylobacter fetus TaxID=196 RepID=UPI0008187988|nr:glycosyltransferase family 9 protein [Campylobacter fetus]OCR86222.1 glycosyl transferase family 9 [Campylobacter fetus subsp. testudinum]
MRINFYELVVKFLLRNKKVIKTNSVSQSFKTVCFFSNTAIGDTLFNTPVFREFKKVYPDKKAIVLLNPSNADLFINSPFIDEVILYNGKWSGFFKTLKILKSKNVDIAFLLHSNEPQATPLAVLSGIKYIFKLPNSKNKFNHFHSNSTATYGKLRYIVLNRLEQLSFIGINSDDTRIELFLEDSCYKNVDKVLKRSSGDKFIGFQMGASTVSRQWFLQRWKELGDLILSNTNAKIVLTGSPSEKHMCDSLEKLLDSKNVLNLAGKFSIKEAAALIDRLDIFITPDTGPLHIAAALRTPTIALFAVAEPKNSNPNFDTDMHKFIKKERTCEICIAKSCKYQACMLQIEAKEVFDMIKEMM